MLLKRICLSVLIVVIVRAFARLTTFADSTVEIINASGSEAAGAALRPDDDAGSALPTSFHCRWGFLTIELRSFSEGNASGDFRAVQDHVEKKAVILVINAQCPITDLGKNVMVEVDADYALDLPHQIGANAKTSDLAPQGSVVRPVEIVAAIQSYIGIEEVIVSRDSLVELRVQGSRELVGNLRLDRANDSTDRGATSVTHQVERIYARLQSDDFNVDKILNNLGNVLWNMSA